MKRMKKTIAVALVGTLLMSFAACGKTEDSSTTSQAEGTTTVTTAEVKADPVALKIHYHAENKYTLNDENGKLFPVFALAAEKTNVIIESTGNPVAQKSKEEFQLQATKKFPDDIYGGDGIRDAVMTYAHQGAFISLNDLIEKSAPNVKKYLDENPDVRKAMTDADGNIYMLNYVPDGQTGRVWLMRMDWLKKVGLEMPKTVEDLETILYAFKNQDPNGNGKNDEIPLIARTWQEMMRTATLWGARVYGKDNFVERVVMTNDGKFYHAWTDPAFRESLVHMAKWYKDEIIDPEIYTRKPNTARSTLWTKDNTGGIIHEWHGSTTSYNYNKDLLALAPEFKLEAFLPPSYNGKPGFEEHRRDVLKPDGWAISANCKNPEAAIKLMDWFYSEEGSNAINFGIEGESYTMVDGKPVFTDEVLKQTAVNTYIAKTYGCQFKVGYPQNYEYERQWTVKEGQDAFKLYADSDAYTALGTPFMNLTADERAIYDQYITGVNTYLDEQVQGFITGKYNIEKEWDKYVKKANELGAQKLVDLYQKVYDDRYNK